MPFWSSFVVETCDIFGWSSISLIWVKSLFYLRGLYKAVFKQQKRQKSPNLTISKYFWNVLIFGIHSCIYLIYLKLTFIVFLIFDTCLRGYLFFDHTILTLLLLYFMFSLKLIYLFPLPYFPVSNPYEFFSLSSLFIMINFSVLDFV